MLSNVKESQSIKLGKVVDDGHIRVSHRRTLGSGLEIE